MNTAPFVALLAVGLLSAGAASAADEFPARKPGLWEVTVESDGAAKQPMRQCADEKTDRELQQMGMGLANTCAKKDVHRDGSRFVVDAVCKFGTFTVTSHSVTTGDFSSVMRTESEARYEPPMMGKSASKTVVNAKWTGACPAGWKAGDMEIDGRRMNIADLMQGMAAGAAGRPPARKANQ